MLTITFLLVLAAFIGTVASAYGRAPLWIAVLFLVIVQLLLLIPVR